MSRQVVLSILQLLELDLLVFSSLLIAPATDTNPCELTQQFSSEASAEDAGAGDAGWQRVQTRTTNLLVTQKRFELMPKPSHKLRVQHDEHAKSKIHQVHHLHALLKICVLCLGFVGPLRETTPIDPDKIDSWMPAQEISDDVGLLTWRIGMMVCLPHMAEDIVNANVLLHDPVSLQVLKFGDGTN